MTRLSGRVYILPNIHVKFFRWASVSQGSVQRDGVERGSGVRWGRGVDVDRGCTPNEPMSKWPFITINPRAARVVEMRRSKVGVASVNSSDCHVIAVGRRFLE